MDWSVFRLDAITLSYGHKNMMPCENKDGAPQKKFDIVPYRLPCFRLLAL
tara:strand:+ start:688 stop:837 length:150 start_codon:yes stop_codon:yes gene_type:complete